MSVAVLPPPDDVMKLRSRHLKRNPNPSKPSRRNRSPSEPEPCRRSKALVVKFPSQNLVMGQVKILKRGEELDRKPEPENQKTQPSKIQNEEENMCSANRFGPEPDKVPKKIHLKDSRFVAVDIYAGSPFEASPSPSSLPVPAFFSKNKDASRSGNKDAKDATNGLRRLLGLNIV